MVQNSTGHILEIGDKVRMNLSTIGEGDLDGIEVTSSGFNYWRYMCQHPDEVYTITAFDYTNEDEIGYNLSGAMADNNWYSDELILLPAAKTRFEVIKNMTLQEMAKDLIPMVIHDLCEEGIPGPEAIEEWLSGSPDKAMT